MSTFIWDNFNSEFLKAVATSSKTKYRPLGTITDSADYIPFMDCITRNPGVAFAKTYRTEIEDFFLKGSPALVSVAKALAEHNYRGVDLTNTDTMLASVKARRGGEFLYNLYVKELRRIGTGKTTTDPDGEYYFTKPFTVDLKTSQFGELPLRPYQENAFGKLMEHFETERAGIMVLPTGSGKTRVATKFLLEGLIAKGYQVIWISHRSMLIEQAAESIYSAAPLLKGCAKDKEKFKLICVSGDHCSIRRAEQDDDVIIGSIQTLRRNLPFLKAVLREKVAVIIDEAHHTQAPSYRTVLKEIRSNAREWKLLGITATPVRANNSDTLKLRGLFDDKIICHVRMADLIAQGVLATPVPDVVNTQIDMDTVIDSDEIRHIRKWGELSADALDKLADIKERNAIIVRKYLDNKEKYGKTLIFALNATHCISLCEELQKNGVKCDYIYCAHPGNKEKIERFKKGELDVLVNINVLSEGSDIPDIQSVFLTRPTSSDVLLMQQIGRGMRGKEYGGTETVNIVDFQDSWTKALPWLTADLLIESELKDTPEPAATVRKKTRLIEWEIIREILEHIHTSFAGDRGLSCYTTLPSGWYDVTDEDACDTKVFFFESQLEGYKKLWANKERFMQNPDYTGENALDEFFEGFGLHPTAYELQLVMDTARAEKEMLHPHALENRKSVDAAIIARDLKEKNIGYKDGDVEIRKIYDKHKRMADSIYGSFEEFYGRVMDCMRFPSGVRPLGMKIDEPEVEMIHYDPTPVYNLDELVQEVVKEMFGDLYGDLPRISWTDGTAGYYFGEYVHPANGRDYIRISSLLNSPSISRETVKYVIYHELLHRDIRNHGSEFRRREHLYPNWVEHDRELDGKFPKFDINYSI